MSIFQNPWDFLENISSTIYIILKELKELLKEFLVLVFLALKMKKLKLFLTGILDEHNISNTKFRKQCRLPV